MGSEIRIRPATEEDLETVRSIFNYYVETSTCTFNLEPQTREECLASFRARTDKATPGRCRNRWPGCRLGRPFPVAATRDRLQPIGRRIVCVDKDHHRKGIGKALSIDMIDRAKALGHRTLIGGKCTEQEASLALQRAMGFRSVVC